jgi:hypothetical protein
MNCFRCGGEDVQPMQSVATNGMVHIRLWCNQCHAQATSRSQPFVSKNGYCDADIAAMPVWSDYYSDNGRVCEYEGCTNTDVELHHWGPRHLFQDYGRWPTSWLCRSLHHPLWHKVTKTGQYRVRE